MRDRALQQQQHQQFTYSSIDEDNSPPTGLLELLLMPQHSNHQEETSHMLMYSHPELKIRFWNSRWSNATSAFSPDGGGAEQHSPPQEEGEFVLECKEEWNLSPHKPRALYVVSAKVSLSKFPETRIITVAPRLVLVNTLGMALRVRQCTPATSEFGTTSASAFRAQPLFSQGRESVERGSGEDQQRYSASVRGSGIVTLLPGERAPFHWRDKNGWRQICARFDEFGWEWSSGVEVGDAGMGEFCARMRNRHTHLQYILRVDIQHQVEDHSLSITFRKELHGLPPCR